MTSSDEPLTEEEKTFLKNEGWEFASEDYIYIPDDYDGCMAKGFRIIRRVIEGIKQRQEWERQNVSHRR